MRIAWLVLAATALSPLVTCNRDEKGDDATEGQTGTVWFWFRAPADEVAQQTLRSPEVPTIESFIVRVDGTFCVQPIAANVSHIHTGSDDCGRQAKTWCEGRLDDKAMTALESLLSRAAQADYAADNVDFEFHERRATARYFLSVSGSRAELTAARDPNRFYPVIATFQAQFRSLYNLSDKTYALVQTLLDVRKRASVRACFQR